MSRSLSRRDLLQKAASMGILSGVASLAGCMGEDGTGGMATQQQQQQAGVSLGVSNIVPSINPSTVEDQFGDVVNLVDDYGADPEGDEPISTINLML